MTAFVPFGATLTSKSISNTSRKNKRSIFAHSVMFGGGRGPDAAPSGKEMCTARFEGRQFDDRAVRPYSVVA